MKTRDCVKKGGHLSVWRFRVATGTVPGGDENGEKRSGGPIPHLAVFLLLRPREDRAGSGVSGGGASIEALFPPAARYRLRHGAAGVVSAGERASGVDIRAGSGRAQDR